MVILQTSYTVTQHLTKDLNYSDEEFYDIICKYIERLDLEINDTDDVLSAVSDYIYYDSDFSESCDEYNVYPISNSDVTFINKYSENLINKYKSSEIASCCDNQTGNFCSECGEKL